MKKYKKIVEQELPRLIIKYDTYAQSPREWDMNLGYFITCDGKYSSPDEHEQIENIIRHTAEEAQNTEDHMQMISNLISTETDEKVIAIYPVCMYEHGDIIYKLGKHAGFDYSNNGFYIVTDKSASVIGAKKEDFEKIIREELEDYSSYANGDVYYWELYDEKGEWVDSGGDYYSFEDIKANLPAEWEHEDLSEYLIND